MRKLNVGIVVLVLSLVIASVSLANAMEIPERPEWMPEVSGGVSFQTKYVWRGQLLVDDYVIQPDAAISGYGFTLGVWGNYDTGVLDRFTELDYTVDYSVTIGDIASWMGSDAEDNYITPLGFSVGYIYYVFPNLTGDAYDSHEYYVGVSYDSLFQPSLTYYRDFETGHGSYWEFGVGHTFEYGEVSADLGATVGYNAGQWGYSDSFSNLLLSGAVNIPVLDNFTVSPNVAYSVSLDRDQYSNHFFGGITFSASY